MRRRPISSDPGPSRAIPGLFGSWGLGIFGVSGDLGHFELRAGGKSPAPGLRIRASRAFKGLGLVCGLGLVLSFFVWCSLIFFVQDRLAARVLKTH